MQHPPITVRGAASVWLTPWAIEHTTASEFLAEMVNGRRAVSSPFFAPPDAKFDHGTDVWTPIGTAEIVVTLVSPDELVTAELGALNASLEKMRAQHHLAQQALLERISKLQAIGYAAETVEAAA